LEKEKEQRKKDLKIIERCKFNKESIPEELRKKYAEELGEYKENPERKKQEYESMQLMNRKDRLAYQMKKKALKERSSKTDFYVKMGIPKEDDPNISEFKRKVLLFYALRRRCSNCGFVDKSLDFDSQLVICTILKKALCYTCMTSKAFAMISATSAGRKYHVDKKDIDMLNLPFIDTPNPYYTALKMKLYYEFMIVENLYKIQQWRDFKKQKTSEAHKEHMEWKRNNKLD